MIISCCRAAHRLAACLIALVSVETVVHADDLAYLQTELNALRAEVVKLRQRVAPDWMTQARDAEVRAMIESVIADADGRNAFQDSAIGAGYDGANFFLTGEGFRLNLSGQLQFRFVHNSDGGTGGFSDNADGFELRRAKLQFKGHLADPKITYIIRLASSRSSANTSLEEAVLAYRFDNGVQVSVGKKKLPFLRQELLSSTRQLAVDRGLSTEYFTLNFAEQIQASVPIGERTRATLAYSDGGTSESSISLSDGVEYAVTGRVDAALLGGFGDGKDLRPLNDEGGAILIGFALHAEEAEATGGETIAWTFDALGKSGPVTGMVAYMGGREEGTDIAVHGLTAEVGCAVTHKVQPFARYDGLWEEGEGNLQAVTMGGNVYLGGHAAKFTADMVWVFAGDEIAPIAGLNNAPTNSGIGLVSGQSEQLAIRAQFQLLF
ncbi:MAG: porin [Planctomycetota bacterium]